MVADKVRALPDLLEQAWTELRAEYQVQASIWESLALLQGGMAGGRTKSIYAAMRQQIEAILDQAAEDCIEAIEGLEDMLQNEKCIANFSNAFEASCRAVFQAEEVSSKRQQLVDCLEEDVDDDDLSEKELETLLVDCQFQDCKLEYRVRQVLRLGLRSAFHHALAQDFDSQVVCKKQVRFDLAEYMEVIENESTRFSDGMFVPAGGVVSL